MKEDLYNYCVKQYSSNVYKPHNPIRTVKGDDFDDIFGTGTIKYDNNRSDSPWGEFTYDYSDNTEESFLKNYGNPLSSVTLRRSTFIVSKGDGKISFRLFEYSRSRRIAGKWFKTRTSCTFVTYNYEKNSLYRGTILNYHLKKKCSKTIRRVQFNSDPINAIRLICRNALPMNNNINIYNTTIITDIVNIFVNSVPGTEKYLELSPEARFYRRHLDSSGIKYPNNWLGLMYYHPQPTKKEYVKCGYKYIDALMLRSKIKGGKVKKILHTVNTLMNFQTFETVCELFGEKFVLNQSDDFLRKLIECNGYYPTINKEIFNKFSKGEKLKIFYIYGLMIDNLVTSSTFNDHIRFYDLISQFEELEWKSKTVDEFVDEHYSWSEKYSYYSNGDFTRVYNESFLSESSRPITDNINIYYPEVLTTSNRYNEESHFQHNCVKTYIKRIDSLLMSMKRYVAGFEERASIEYKILLKDDGTFKLLRGQTLGRRNRSLDDSWTDALTKLDEQIYYLVDSGYFNTLKIVGDVRGNKLDSNWSSEEKVISYYKSTSDELTKTMVKELKWENPLIMKITSQNNTNDLFIDF